MANQQGFSQYARGPLSFAVEEAFGRHHYEDDYDQTIAEALQNQEIIYKSICVKEERDSTCGSPIPISVNHTDASGHICLSSGSSLDSLVASDEALAWELQKMENELAGTTIQSEEAISGTEVAETVVRTQVPTSNGRSSSDRGMSDEQPQPQVEEEDGIDPDNMTYEELLEVTEAIGTESRGLSIEQISLLRSSTFRSGIFNRKRKDRQCVICCAAYKNGDKLIELPCRHDYHKSCGTKWLTINKACPVCNDVVSVDVPDRSA